MENMLRISPADENLILRHSEILKKPVKIRLVNDHTGAGNQMNAFCTALEQLLPAVRIVREAADDDSPGIHVSDNIHFMMVPTGEFLEGFLLALLGSEALASQEMGIGVDDLNTQVALPVLLKAYVAPQCPFCKKVLPKLLFLAGGSSGKIDVTLIDAMMFTDLAKADNIRSVPTTIMDDRFRWTGDFEMTEVIGMIAGRNPMQLGAETLKKMIGIGDAEGVAALMDEFNTLIPAFPDLLVSQKWTQRLGAMVAFEYLVEKNPSIAQNIIDVLWEKFETLDFPIMGDVLHLVGMFNQSSQATRLQEVLKGQYPESVKTVAKEIYDGLMA